MTINIGAPEILAIPIIECHEALVDLKQQDVIAYGPTPENEWTVNDYTKIRQSVYEKLCMVQSSLPHQWRLRLYEGYRSLTVQKLLFDDAYAIAKKYHPTLSPEALFYESTRLASPVINLDGSANIPAHNTGGAVDVEIIDEHDNLIDMGMAVKDWLAVKPSLCITHCTDLTEKARQHRKLLLQAMEAQGFVNYFTEWWHFSFGDRYWAYHQQQQVAIYGSADNISCIA